MKVQFFADLDNITNKRGSDELILKLITQEISDEQAGIVMSLRNKYLNVMLGVSEPTQEDVEGFIDDFSKVPTLDKKTPSQRLRNVLYLQWEGKYKLRYPDFDKFYNYKMEEIIEAQKDLIS